MSSRFAARLRLASLGGIALAMAGCTVAPPPVLQTTQLAAPPLVSVPPLRPTPPFSASLYTEIPQRDALGNRQTINTGITSTETLWNLRSAWNVAALNCLSDRYQPIGEGYRLLLENNESALSAANTELDAQFRRDFGGNFKRTRDSHSTRVYNYFALPPARGGFCDAALDVANRYLADTSVDPATFATANFSAMEQPFETFYRAYEEYERASAAWDAQYGARYGASQPGYVAVQKARGGYIPQPGISDAATLTTNAQINETKVVDPDTGAEIPVVPVNTTSQSVPVVQPIPNDAGENDTPQD